MGLALLLVIVVIAELVCTVWMLARQRSIKKLDASIKKRVARLEKNVTKMAEVLRDMSEDYEDETLPDAGLSDLVASATPEDIAKANEILKQLGIEQSKD